MSIDVGGRAVIACSDLTKEFDGVEVVKRLGLSVGSGTIVGLIGPSGCGKTTTVRLLTGIYAPSSGRAEINGAPASTLSHRQRRQLGYLPQIPAAFPELSVWQNLSFHASMYGLRLRRRKRLHELLQWVELDEHRHKRVRDISGGMRRRLALAASIVHNPPIVFLDEPTAGIDPILRAKFWESFREMREEGRTLLVSTQYVSEAAYCDVVGVLSDGELLMLDTPRNLRRAAFEGEVVDVELARRVDDEDLVSITGLPGVISAPQEVEPRRWRIVVDDAEAAVTAIGAELERLGLPVVEVVEHVVDYDEAFVRVIERARASTPPEVHGAVRAADLAASRASS